LVVLLIGAALLIGPVFAPHRPGGRPVLSPGTIPSGDAGLNDGQLQPRSKPRPVSSSEASAAAEQIMQLILGRFTAADDIVKRLSTPSCAGNMFLRNEDELQNYIKKAEVKKIARTQIIFIQVSLSFKYLTK
jgi:hypothetical protein